MKLTGEQSKKLQDALLDAFRQQGELEQCVKFHLNVNLGHVAGGKNLAEVIFHLIDWADSSGRVEELLNAALTQKPGNQLLKAVAAELFPAREENPAPGPAAPSVSAVSISHKKITRRWVWGSAVLLLALLLVVFLAHLTGPPAASSKNHAQPQASGNSKAQPSLAPKSVDGTPEIWIPGGAFVMGSDPSEIDMLWDRFKWEPSQKPPQQDESPAHPVQVDGFWLYQHEVTVAQYRAYCAATQIKMPPAPDGGWHETHPMVNITWEEAKAYCDWLSQRSGKHYRLPSEAEWEYAARGGKTGLNGQARTLFVWGDELPQGNARVGNLADTTLTPDRHYFPAYTDGYRNTAPVGSFQANGYQLHDMAGNVWEWCGDWYAADYYRKREPVNPRGPANGDHRVIRGGSWYYYTPPYLRLSSRARRDPDHRADDVGFRPARDE